MNIVPAGARHTVLPYVLRPAGITLITMAMDWKDSLASLLNNADLPQGDESVVATDDNTASKSTPDGKRVLRLFYEKKGRGGKPATIIEGFAQDGSEDEECEKLAAMLKKRLGRGGSARGGEILIQGDCRELLKPLLAAEGFLVKG